MSIPFWLIALGLLGFLLQRILRSGLIRRMPFLALYVAFWGVATPLMGIITIFGSRRLYWTIYWLVEAIGYTFSAMLALSLILSVTRSQRRRLDLYGLILMIFLLPFCSCIGAGDWRPWLNVAHWCDVAVMWGLLYSMVWQHDRWDMPEADLALVISIGLIVGFGGHALCGLLQGNHDPAPWLRASYQLAGIMQLAIWFVALGKGQSRPCSPVRIRQIGAMHG